MRSRQHVVIARLNDEEYAVYQRVLRQAIMRYKGILRNDSERFRATLMVMNEFLKNKAYQDYWMNVEV